MFILYWFVFLLYIRVWGEDIQGVDCGQTAADWLNKFLEQTKYRLIYCASGIRLRKLASDTADRSSVIQ